MSRASTPSLSVDGRVLAVRLRANARARAVSLRLDVRGPSVVLVVPPGVDEATAIAFARTKEAWLRDRLSLLPPETPFRDGACVPVLGVSHTLRHQPDARRGVWREDGFLNVSGRAEHMARRVRDWLRARALAEVTTRARAHAARLNRTPGRIAVKDTRSRWGSCTARGDMAFCWRLVLAPEAVLDYVCAHEAAHLVEMNHSPRFWALVRSLVGDPRPAREWLKRHGAGLHRYG